MKKMKYIIYEHNNLTISYIIIFTNILDDDKPLIFMKNVAIDCKVAANKLFTPNTNPWLSLLTHFAISELY